MSPEFAKKIFEPFERERTSTVSRIQGTGLGMAITKNIVDMMGGTIEVQTAQGKGSEFIIRVPLRVLLLLSAGSRYDFSTSARTCSRCGISSGFAMWPFIPAFNVF